MFELIGVLAVIVVGGGYYLWKNKKKVVIEPGKPIIVAPDASTDKPAG